MADEEAKAKHAAEVAEFYRREREAKRQSSKQLNEPYYDPSLAAAISQRLGPGFQSAYNPRVKHFVKTPYEPNLHGVYGNLSDKKAAADSDHLYVPFSLPGSEVEYSTRVIPKHDQVYNFATKPDPTIFAHEYRHRGGVKFEGENRRYDAMYAQTPDEWDQAVYMWRDYLNQLNPDAEVELTQAEKDLVSNLERSAPDLLRQEYRAAPEGDKPYAVGDEPDFSGYLEYLKNNGEFSEDYYATRSQLPYKRSYGDALARRDRIEKNNLMEETAALMRR